MFRFFFSFVMILSSAFAVSAKETNLKSTLEATYNNNYLIAQQREKLLKYNEIVTQQLSKIKPNVSASLSQNLEESNGKYNNSASITINQLLFDGGHSLNSIDAAKYNVYAERELLIKTEQDNLLKAITVYMDLRQAEANLDLAENNIKVIKEQLRAAKNRFEVGEVTRTDVSQTEARLALAVSNVETRKAVLTGKSAAYLLVVGEDHGDLSTPPKHPRIPNTFTEAEKIALENHPRILAASLQLKGSEYRVDASQRIFSPTITGSITSKAGSSISSSTGATIQATIPLFNSGNLRSKKRAAINDKKISKHALDIALLTTAFEGMREESKLGSRTTLDVLDAEQALLSARSNLVSALRDEQVQAYSVLSEMGKLTTSNLGLEVQNLNPTANYDKITKISPLGKARIKILEKLKKR